MGNELRETGSEIIGNVPWSTHFCQFYQTRQDLLDILIPYFKAGLENNEFCMWVTAEPLSSREANKAMTKTMPDFAKYLAKGQIEIVSHDKWYLQDGVFDSQAVLDGWIDKLDKALAKGYDGLRLTGNTFWLDKCSAADVLDVIRNHEFALIKQEGEWELLERSGYTISKMALIESEDRFRLASSASHTMVYDVFTDTGKVVAVSGFEELTGYQPQEIPLTRDWWYSQIHPADLPLVKKQLAEIITGAQDYLLQYHIRHKRGHYVTIEDTPKLVRVGRG